MRKALAADEDAGHRNRKDRPVITGKEVTIMLKHRKNIPLDYSLCQDTVTVYHREGLTRRVVSGVHFEDTARRNLDTGRVTEETGFLLIIPGGDRLSPGDRVVLGEGPQITSWADTAGFATVESVKHCRFRGQVCHTEVRG